MIASMLYKFFDKKSNGDGVATELNYQLSNEFHKQIIRKFKRRKVYSSFRDNIWHADLSDMQPLSKCNKGFRYLLCAIDLFIKYAWVLPLKNMGCSFERQKSNSIVNAFQKLLVISNRKPKKIWVYQGGEFYNNLFKQFLKNNNTEMHSTYNEGKFVTAERFIRT